MLPFLECFTFCAFSGDCAKTTKKKPKKQKSFQNRWKNGPGALKIGEKTVPEPPGRPQNAPEALGTCPGSLKKPRPKTTNFRTPRNQRPGGPKRVFWGPKWRKKTQKSTKHREKVDKIMEKRDLLKHATPTI